MKKLLTLSLGFFLSLTQASQAQIYYSGKQSENREQQQNTTSGAMRGCRRNLPTLQVLAPADHIALIGEKKTFLLNLSEIPRLPVRISILEPLVSEPIWQKPIKIEKAGLFPISLPENINLEENKDYVFTAVLPCDPEIPGSSSYVRVLFQKSDFQVQEPKPVKELSRLLAKGIWYDALWIAYEHQLPEFQQLLDMESIDLSIKNNEQR